MSISFSDEARKGATPVQKIALGAVLACSLIETPFELEACSCGAQVAALISSKLLLTMLIFYACYRSPVARYIALFVCGVSILAVVPALPAEYQHYRLAFLLSITECMLKALAIAALLYRGEAAASCGRWQGS
jgi:hypothetical protein